MSKGGESQQPTTKDSFRELSQEVMISKLNTVSSREYDGVQFEAGQENVLQYDFSFDSSARLVARHPNNYRNKNAQARFSSEKSGTPYKPS